MKKKEKGLLLVYISLINKLHLIQEHNCYTEKFDLYSIKKRIEQIEKKLFGSESDLTSKIDCDKCSSFNICTGLRFCNELYSPIKER